MLLERLDYRVLSIAPILIELLPDAYITRNTNPSGCFSHIGRTILQYNVRMNSRKGKRELPLF